MTAGSGVALLPGRSAWWWSRVEQIAAIVGWVLLGAGLLAGFATLVADAAWVRILFWVSLPAGFALAFLEGHSVSLARRRERAEISAGYTTHPRSERTDVPLVDPRDGRVLRPAG